MALVEPDQIDKITMFAGRRIDPIADRAALGLIALSFFTSLITATFSLGGGSLMISAMALILPPVVVVPPDRPGNGGGAGNYPDRPTTLPADASRPSTKPTPMPLPRMHCARPSTWHIAVPSAPRAKLGNWSSRSMPACANCLSACLMMAGCWAWPPASLTAGWSIAWPRTA